MIRLPVPWRFELSGRALRAAGRLLTHMQAAGHCHVDGTFEEDAATIAGMKRTTLPLRTSVTDTISYAGYRFPPDVISYAVWLYYRFPLSLRMVEELLAARGIECARR